MTGTIPIVSSLSEIYTPDVLPGQKARWQSLLSTFETIFPGSEKPQFVARSPGRVNLIGEHIDYSLYGVLPMAIAADALLAVSVIPYNGDKDKDRVVFEIANVEADKFPSRTFSVMQKCLEGREGEEREWHVEIDPMLHEWTNYFKSGLRGALALLQRQQHQNYKYYTRGNEYYKDNENCAYSHQYSSPAKPFKPVGMRILVSGNVPVGGGLSSSAAFVSASALAVCYANLPPSRAIDKTSLTELAIVSERAVGINSGGMDQAASVLSCSGAALHVTFVPSLKAVPVPMPIEDNSNSLRIVVAQSFVSADKHVTGPVHYNLRVVECTLAAVYLNALLHPQTRELPIDASPLGVSLRGFHTNYFTSNSSDGDEKNELRILLALADEKLSQEEGYTREEIASVLKISVSELEERFMTSFPVRAERFKLRQRAMHVFAEALRVLEFLDLLQHAATVNKKSGISSIGKELGRLMNETQDSCRKVYDCSCPEIDKLCAIARRNGSLGSRLTGAGWGGCSVHLVPADRVDDVRKGWEDEYYKTMKLTLQQRETAVVVSRPGSGSALWVVGKSSFN